jgi:hypothetical protein
MADMKPTALAVSRPSGSPIRFSFGSSGRFSSTIFPCDAPVQTKMRSGGSMPRSRS